MLVHNSTHNADSQKSIFTKMTKAWNDLPLTLCSIKLCNAFKSNLKTHSILIVLRASGLKATSSEA